MQEKTMEDVFKAFRRGLIYMIIIICFPPNNIISFLLGIVITIYFIITLVTLVFYLIYEWEDRKIKEKEENGMK